MGAGVRVGSVVGFTEFGGEETMALGGQIAVGHRLGRATLEVELDYLEISERTDRYFDRQTGDMLRLGVTGRLDVARIGVGERSLLVLFFESGVGRQRTAWYRGDTGARTDTHVGMGWLLDHRSRRSQLLPAVGWHVGWRLTAARGEDAAHMQLPICRGKDCAMPPAESGYDTGLLVSSGLMVSW